MEKAPHQTEEGRQDLSLLLAGTSFLPPAKRASSQTPHFGSPYLPDSGFSFEFKIVSDPWRRMKKLG